MSKHEYGGSSPLNNAPDVTKKANLVIWMYFFGFAVALWGMIVLVDIYFRIESGKEADAKVGLVQSTELAEQRAFEAQVLSGKRGLLEGKKNISIEEAMNKIIQVTQ